MSKIKYVPENPNIWPPNTDSLFFILASIARSTFLQWYPEVSHFCETTPILLIGTKIDLRRDDQTKRMLGAQGQTPVTAEQGEAVARNIGAKYMECSAKTGAGVQEVFNAALKESLNRKWGKKLKTRRCVVL